MARRDHYQEITDRIIAALEVGVAPWACPWDRRGGRPLNGHSGHVYQGINVILLALLGYADPRWYTYRQAKQLRAHVRKGEKGTRVVYWKFIDRPGDQQDDDGDDGDCQSRKIPILRVYTVFNHEQVEWPEGGENTRHAPPPITELDVQTGFERAASFVQASGADVRHGGVRAYYDLADDHIQMPEVGRFESPDAFWATTLHELSHWTGHADRCARDLTGRFGSEAYAMEEMVAEMAAAFLCADLMIPGQLQHAEYIGSWLRVLRDDRKAVFTAARQAQTAAGYIQGLEPAQDVDDAQDGEEAA